MAHSDGKETEIVPLSSKASIIEKGGLIISSSLQLRALKFVLLIGVMSFFADFVYEGSRGIIGPYLALLGASAFTVAVVTGFGEFVGYAWRLVSGSLSDRDGAILAYYNLWLYYPDGFSTVACFGGELADGSRAHYSGAIWPGDS